MQQKQLYFDYISPRCGLDIENSEPFFLRDTLVYDAAYPYQVWRQNVLCFRRYCPDKYSLTFWTFSVTLTLNAVIPFSHRTLRLMMLYKQTKCDCKRTRSLQDRILKKSCFDYIGPRSDLGIEDSEPFFFRMTHRLVIIRHHTKFG